MRAPISPRARAGIEANLRFLATSTDDHHGNDQLDRDLDVVHRLRPYLVQDDQDKASDQGAVNDPFSIDALTSGSFDLQLHEHAAEQRGESQ